MVETKDKTIDGKRVTVSQFPARRALNLKIRLIKLMGPSIVQLFGKAKAITTSMPVEDIIPAMERLTAALDPDQFVDLILELLSMTRVDGREACVNFDMEFAGNLPFVYKIVWYVLEVNFGNFFGQNGIGKALNQLNTAQQTPMASN